jgi:hypothetical protein
MRARLALIFGLLLFLGCLFSPAAAQAPRPSSPMILALGSTSWLNASDIQAATGAVVKQDMGQFQLKDFAVIVLANVAFAGLPGPVQQGLVDYVTNGGAVLITGGTQSFGSGGYQAVASIIPFQIRTTSDWRPTPFRPPVPIQPGHPIMAGVTFLTVGAVNDMNPRPDASEILQAAGGGSAAGRAAGTGGTGGGSFPYPLIAEVGVGAGRVIGIASDLNEFAGMRDRDLFVRNTMGYLLRASRMGRG